MAVPRRGSVTYKGVEVADLRSATNPALVFSTRAGEVRIGYTLITEKMAMEKTARGIIKEVMRKEMKRLLTEARRVSDKMTDTWERENQPDWRFSQKTTRDVLRVTMQTSGTFAYLDAGTSKRYAVVKGSPKTRVRSFAQRGSGTVAVIAGREFGRRRMRPRKGIKARRWTFELAKLVKPVFEKRFQEKIIPQIASLNGFWGTNSYVRTEVRL